MNVVIVVIAVTAHVTACWHVTLLLRADLFVLLIALIVKVVVDVSTPYAGNRRTYATLPEVSQLQSDHFDFQFLTGSL